MDVLSSFTSIFCHSDWLFHRESCPCLDVVYTGHVWSSSPACTWHCSLHYSFLQAIPLAKKRVFMQAKSFLWLPLHVIIFLPCGFFFYLSFFFFPRLISTIADWMSTILPHMVWPQCKFRMQVWNVLHAARWKYRMQKWRQKLPSAHHRTTLSCSIFATKACIDNRKKNLLSSNMSSSLPDELRSPDITLTTFRNKLKTLLFNVYVLFLAHLWHPQKCAL